MQPFILVIHVLVAMLLVVLVLMQHGKGADIGAAFGSGSSNTMFGSAGATPFLMKITIVLATIFFATSIGLSFLVSRTETPQNQMQIPSAPAQTNPASMGIPNNTPPTNP